MLNLTPNRRRSRRIFGRRTAAAVTALVTALGLTVVAAPAAFAAEPAGAFVPLSSPPEGLAASGDTAWVTGSTGVRKVTNKGATVGAVVATGTDARGVAVAPNGQVWVANYGSNTVSVINPSTSAVVRNISTGTGTSPIDVAIGSEGTAYVANRDSSTVSVIAPGSNTVTRTVALPTGAFPNAIAVGPDGSVYTSNFSPDTISMIAPGGTTVTKTIDTGSGPRDVLVGPDGTVYVAYSYDPNNTWVSGVNVYSSTLDNPRSIPMANTVRAAGLALSAQGTLYVSQYSPDTIAVVPGVPQSLTVSRTLAMTAPASGPTKVAVLSDNTVLAGSIYQRNDLSRWSQLTPTTASLPIGRVDLDYAVTLGVTGGQAPYTWSLVSGSLPDGLSLASTTGIISGRPSRANAQQVPNVTLRVTDSAGVTADVVYRLQVDPLAPTVTVQSSSSGQLPLGQTADFTASVSPVQAAGQITFTAVAVNGGGRTDLGTSTLNSGTTKVTAALPGYGGYRVEARYSPSSPNQYGTAVATSGVIQSRATPGALTVTKFHPSATADANWFVEFTNTTSTAIPVSTVRLALGSTDTALTGTVAPGRRFVVAGQGGAFAAAADQRVNLASGSGVSLTAADGYDQTPATVLDAVGTNAGPHTGAGLPAYTSADVPNASAWVRNTTFAGPVNTGQNAADFQLVSATGGTVGGLPAVAGNAQPVGNANPLLLSARTAPSGLLDPSKSAAEAPNRVVAQQSGATQLVVNRIITNNTGRRVNQMALQINTLSQPNAPVPSGVTGQTAWLRPVNPSSPTQQINVNGQPVTVQRLSVASGTGAGLGSMLTVPLPEEGLAPGATVAVQLTFAVDRPGKFWFSYLAMTS